MKNFSLSFLLVFAFSACKKDVDLQNILPGTWVSEQVKVSGEDITALSMYTMTFGDTTVLQVLQTNLNGNLSISAKPGTYKIAGDEKITVQFAGENASDWTARSDSETDLKLEFSRNGEQFFIDFFKK